MTMRRPAQARTRTIGLVDSSAMSPALLYHGYSGLVSFGRCLEMLGQQAFLLSECSDSLA